MQKSSLTKKTILALSETAYYDDEFPVGRNMEFWLGFDDEQSLKSAYDMLKEGAEIHYPLAACEWSTAMTALTDKYGLNWLLSI